MNWTLRDGLAVGGLVALAALSALTLTPASAWAPGLILALALAALAVIDARTLRLPDLITLPTLMAGLAACALYAPERALAHAIGALSGYGILAGAAVLYRRARGREGLGLGDAKLLAAGGAWLGWAALPSVLLAASLCAGVWVLATRPRGAFAFGPALALGVWLVWLRGPIGGVGGLGAGGFAG